MRNDARGRFPPGTPDHVLVVEDEQRLREMLLRAAGEMGYQAVGVGSAEAALRSIEKQPCGTMILDLNLPGMEGLELLTTVRKRWPDIQAIILTGFGDLEAAKQAIHLDVVDFLTKPCALGDIEIALDRARRRNVPRPPILERGDREPEEAEDPDGDPAESARAAGSPAKSQHSALEFAPRESSAAMSLEDIEREHIVAALRKHGGNRNATATELGISLRKLYYRLAQYQKSGHL